MSKIAESRQAVAAACRNHNAQRGMSIVREAVADDAEEGDGTVQEVL